VSLIRRLFGAGNAEQHSSTVILYDSATDLRPREAPSESSTTESSRRRRGGRGRGKNGDSAPQGDRSQDQHRNSQNAQNGHGAQNGHSRNNGKSPSATNDRKHDGPRDGRRWRRPPLSSLEAPLPEDVAFRPAAEGGDASIAPPRRRPSGPRIDRVLYAGIKQYVPRVGSAADLPAPPELTEVEASSDEPHEGEGEHKPRRRGRRGGRGRRRTDTTDASGLAEADDESGEADDDDDEPVASVPVSRNGHTPQLDTAPAVEEVQLPPRTVAVDVDPSTFPPAFRALGLDDRTLALMAVEGFTEPTPIQEQTIPLLMQGRDVVGVAQTGTGKTLAFGIPMVERLDSGRRAVQGLVLVPTRELAQQVLEVLRQLGESYGLDVVGLLGGRALDRDFRALERRPHIVVGTPGRVIDHLHRGTLSLADVRYAVLDEADQMLDIGFLPDITRILSRTPRARQTALFSATMPHSILRLVRRYMNEPDTVTIAPEQTTVETVEQVYFEVAQRDKTRGLRELIERELRGRTLVFSRTRRGVDDLKDQLQTGGIRVGALHGDMDQRKRDQVVHQFRDGALDILVATNVAARGLDIPEITHVLNYDVPQNAEEYVHRIGRTGRAGREGKAITFVCERDIAEFDTLLAAFGDRLHKEHLELYAEPTAKRSALSSEVSWLSVSRPNVSGTAALSGCSSGASTRSEAMTAVVRMAAIASSEAHTGTW
jgi:ATP-dependent RNA helicase DeaD